MFHNIDQAIEVLKQGTASDTTRDSRARKRTSEAEHSEPATKSPRLADDGREQVSAHTYFLIRGGSTGGAGGAAAPPT